MHLLELNTVLLARHFQYSAEIFFKAIVLDSMLGKIKYHAIQVEFQVRGGPHIHLWTNEAYEQMSSTVNSLPYGDAVIGKPEVLLMAPTGAAAIQVDGITLNTTLGTPVEHFGTKLPPLYVKMKCSLRNYLSDLKAIIIDEIIYGVKWIVVLHTFKRNIWLYR